MRMQLIGAGVAACAAVMVGAASAEAQQDLPSKVDLVFNRYHTAEEINKALTDLAAAYPQVCRVQAIGKSLEGRDLLVLTVGTAKGGEIDDKPAMWIDGAVHANEVQAAEAVLYTAWYLTKAYGTNKSLTELVDHCSFHLLPMVNPDSRVAWLNGPSSPNN
ncbi:MAG: M14 family zinc carboxypeptidase, partial [Planctomycetota bacterium]|nr:M14 family zinc carboxypeptidase [Planctomycetota bacterium]